jgi:ferritin-like metal-binding protein YciE
MVKEHLRETEAELSRLQSIINENTISEEDIDHSMNELESQLDSRLD